MKKILFIALLVFMLPLSASAQVDSFIDSNFDFSQVQTAYIVPLFIEQLPGQTGYQPEIATNRPALLKTQEVLTTPEGDYTYQLSELTIIDWPQPYVKLLQAAREHADIIIFTDQVEYSSPPARVEQVKLTYPDISTAGNANLDNMNHTNDFSQTTTWQQQATTNDLDNNQLMQDAAVPVFLPGSDFPALRIYAVSKNDLNVPVMSIYYQLPTNVINLSDEYAYYHACLENFLGQLNLALTANPAYPQTASAEQG